MFDHRDCLSQTCHQTRNQGAGLKGRGAGGVQKCDFPFMYQGDGAIGASQYMSSCGRALLDITL